MSSTTSKGREDHENQIQWITAGFPSWWEKNPLEHQQKKSSGEDRHIIVEIKMSKMRSKYAGGNEQLTICRIPLHMSNVVEAVIWRSIYVCQLKELPGIYDLTADKGSKMTSEVYKATRSAHRQIQQN